jgi:uncharacterized integral membrane protein (TIGR00698 family)
MATVWTIGLAFALGALLKKLLKIDRDSGWLLTMGTAICGGSAIAALAPVIRAKPTAIILAISIVFLLNAIALIVFPLIGSTLQLSPEQFGWWSALAIHDTSSVVGAAASFHPDAVAIATTAKLARSLWIIPIVLCFALIEHQQRHNKWPWFIAGFVAASAIGSLWPMPAVFLSTSKTIAHGLFAVALFGIGSQFHQQTLRNLSWRPLLMAVLLWLLLASTTLFWVT